jgi:hypothetical protein
MSWKVNGGNLEKTNNIFVNRLSANYFTLKNDYEGHLTINGTLDVNKESRFHSDVVVDGTLHIDKDVVANSSIRIHKDALINKTLTVDGNSTLSGNVLIRGNLHLMQNYTMEKLLFVNGNSIHLGVIAPQTLDAPLYNVNLLSNGSNLGINRSGATYGLDLSCSHQDAMRVSSSGATCVNVLAQNNESSSVTLATSLESTDISLNSSTEVGLLRNVYGKGMQVICDRTLLLLAPKLDVGSQDNGSACTIYGKEGIAVDILPDIAATDDVSVQLRAPSGEGLVLSGGRDRETKERSTASMDLLCVDDAMKKKLNVQTIVANSKYSSKNKFTMGINTAHPDYRTILDVNGPMRVGHEEVTTVYESTDPIHRVIFGANDGCRNVGIILGTIRATNHTILYTVDGGDSWQESVFDAQSINANVELRIRCGVVYNATTALLGGDFGLLLYTIDGFQTWHRVSGMFFSDTISSLCVCLKDSLHIVCFVYGSHTLGYFTLSSLAVLANTNLAGSAHEFDLTAHNADVSTLEDGRSYFYGNKPNASAYGDPQKIVGIAYDEIDSVVAVATTDGTHVLRLTTANASNIFTYDSAARESYDGTTSVQGNVINMYGTVSTLGDDVVLNDIYVLNSLHAIAAGTKGSIYVTLDGGLHWTTQWINDVSVAPLNLLNVTMTDSSSILFLLENEDREKETHVYRIVKCYLPELFNFGNYTVLTVTGNFMANGEARARTMVCDGQLTVGGNIGCRESLTVDRSITTKKIFGDSVNGVDGRELTIGTNDGSQLVVKGNACMDQCTFRGNVTVGGKIQVDSICSPSGNLSLGKNMSIRIVEHSNGYSNDVYLGNLTDNVMIRGNNLVIQGGISTVQNQIQLRAKAHGIQDSAGAGILIRDNDDDYSGFIRLNPTLDGYEFKSSVYSPNILNIRVNELRVDGKKDSITGNPMKTGLAILQSTPDLYGDNDRSGCTMTSAPFDVQNIILGDYARNGSSASRQTIGTDLHIAGRTCVDNASDAYNANSGSLQVLGGASIQKNVFVGGNLHSARSDLERTTLSLGTAIRDRLDVLGPTYVSGNTTFANGTSFFLGNLESSGHSVFRGNATHVGPVFFSGNVTALASTSVRTISVEKESTFFGNVDCRGAMALSNTENVNKYIDGVTVELGAVRIGGGMAV